MADTQKLQKSMLFKGMREEEIQAALHALDAAEKTYQKGDIILYAGDTTQQMGFVLEGSVTIESNDVWGNRTILSHVGKGQFFAETYALLQGEPLLVDVVANENCRILFLQMGELRGRLDSDHVQTDHASAGWTARLTANLLNISLHKNLLLARRNFHTAPKSIRGRVMAYLNTMALQKGGREFDIPFDRQQLADYLNVERTALSKELGRMQKDGLIKVSRNHFEIIAAASV